MPETVDKSSLSTLFPRYSPQLRLIDFFSRSPVSAGFAPLFASALPVRASCFRLLFVSFLFLFCYISLPLSSSFFFSVTARLFLSRALSHILWMLPRKLSYFPPASFPFCSRRAVPPPCYPFLPFRFSFASFCFRLILLLPHFAFAASSSAYGFLLSFAFPGRDACAFIPPCYTVHIFSLSPLYEHIHTQGGSQHDR